MVKMVKIEWDPAAAVITFAKITLDRLSKEFSKNLARVCSGVDEENIHLLRVTIRRLLTLIRVFPQHSSTHITKPLATLLKRLFRSLSQARDLSVQTDTLQQALQDMMDPELKKGLKVLHWRISQKKKDRLIKIKRSLCKNGKHVFRALIAKLNVKNQRNTSGPPAKDRSALMHYADPILSRAIRKFESHESCLKEQDNKMLLHKMRIDVKKYRYIMEIFQPVLAPDVDAHLAMIKRIQAELGEIHDCDVWLDFLPKFEGKERLRIERLFGNAGLFDPIKPGIDWFEKDRSRQRQELFAKFLVTWKQYKKMQAPTWNRVDSGLYCL